MHKIHKTAQMTGKQQKPTHYKITQIYIQIHVLQIKRITAVSDEIHSIKYGRISAIFIVLARFGMAAC